jgi:hypothetical protein
MPKFEDWRAERGEFELPVPICQHSDDGISANAARCFAEIYGWFPHAFNSMNESVMGQDPATLALRGSDRPAALISELDARRLVPRFIGLGSPEAPEGRRIKPRQPLGSVID